MDSSQDAAWERAITSNSARTFAGMLLWATSPDALVPTSSKVPNTATSRQRAGWNPLPHASSPQRSMVMPVSQE